EVEHDVAALAGVREDAIAGLRVELPRATTHWPARDPTVRRTRLEAVAENPSATAIGRVQVARVRESLAQQLLQRWVGLAVLRPSDDREVARVEERSPAVALRHDDIAVGVVLAREAIVDLGPGEERRPVEAADLRRAPRADRGGAQMRRPAGFAGRR